MSVLTLRQGGVSGIRDSLVAPWLWRLLTFRQVLAPTCLGETSSCSWVKSKPAFVLQHDINTVLSSNPSCLRITAPTVGTKVSWHRVGFIPRNWICQGVVIETEWGNVKVSWAKPDRENSCLLLSWGWGGAMSTYDYQIWVCLSPLNKRDKLTQCNLCLVSHIFNVNYLKCPLTVFDITPAVCFWHSVQCVANPRFAFQGARSVCFPK